MDDATVRVEMRFKNARLYNAIAAASVCVSSDSRVNKLHKLGPVKAFCDLHGLPLQSVYLLLNLRTKPIDSRQRVRALCQRLSDLLLEPVDILFPADVYAISWKSVAVEIAPKMISLRAATNHRALIAMPTQDADHDQDTVGRIIGETIKTLTPREQRVLTARFGLDGEGEQTLYEVAREIKVSAERVRQIEMKALRKMRHPSRSRRLRPFIRYDDVVVDAKNPVDAAYAHVPTGLTWKGWRATVHAAQSHLRTGQWTPDDTLDADHLTSHARVTHVRVPTGRTLEDGRVLIIVSGIDRYDSSCYDLTASLNSR